MAQLTIFEGPDCSGKSTNAQKYIHEFGGVYVHCGSEAADDPLLYFVGKLKPLFDGQDVVLDRSWLSDIIYGTHVRGWTKMTQEMMEFFEDTFYMFQPVTFMHIGNKHDMLRLWESRKREEYVQSRDTFECVIEAYRTTKNYPGKLIKVNGFSVTPFKLKELRENAWK
jgi:thymidylate kinase